MEIPKVTSKYRYINEILFSGYAPAILTGALELGVFDALVKGPADAKGLADRLGTIMELTEALADTLVSMKLLDKNGTEYSLDSVAMEFLVSSSKTYRGVNIIKSKKSSRFDHVMNQIPDILKNGPTKPDKETLWSGIEFMRSIGKSTMTGSLQNVTEFITGLPEFPELKHVCDLGGNHGFYTMALLDRNPQLRGTVCDLPRVANISGELIKEMGYEDRMTAVGVDLSTEASFGEGYDLIFTSHILYSWKEKLKEFFDRIGRALTPGGLFVSNHMSMPEFPGAYDRTVELMTRLMGSLQTHYFSEHELKDALGTCGFGGFEVKRPEDNHLILAARKI